MKCVAESVWWCLCHSEALTNCDVSCVSAVSGCESGSIEEMGGEDRDADVFPDDGNLTGMLELDSYRVADASVHADCKWVVSVRYVL